MVFVLNTNKRPLNPCHPAKARKLLKEGKAVIHKKFPFTIRLKREKVPSTNHQSYRIKIDVGSKITGLAIMKVNEVVFLAELHHKTDIKLSGDMIKAKIPKGKYKGSWFGQISMRSTGMWI